MHCWLYFLSLSPNFSLICAAGTPSIFSSASCLCRDVRPFKYRSTLSSRYPPAPSSKALSISKSEGSISARVIPPSSSTGMSMETVFLSTVRFFAFLAVSSVLNRFVRQAYKNPSKDCVLSNRFSTSAKTSLAME